ncbi:phosphoribosylglycinamide formyltransferase [Phocea massiliensis]|uniref:Phosphoribosylglycinamide formyltransferase n=2 Tax=Oscillospiraceae TaxID=216572 RepID=A0A6N2SLK6_9FIRM|nr:phosphoribosylglycinamide formyltransferase [Merdimmobilis hominis]MCD4836162.1 phosphoribosylglycinamide formyltransferase [Merdimmobilis hominis]PWL63280.1 MAG: phosphoribosylglycinamide formyltransferase [Oscillospiraceae bacterium]
MLNIAVFVSGGGTNFQALIDAQRAGKFPGGEITLCVSSSKNAYALERARQNGIETAILRRRDYPSQEALDDALLDVLEAHDIGLIVLAGYLSILSERVVRAYDRKIINVHPSLIPSFCGAGYYGLKVHEAALAYGVKVTGATVHFVNEIPDAGKIILQKAVEVREGDTPEILQRRVMEEAEWQLLPQAVAMFCQGEI